MAEERLQKVLAQAGIASRRKAEEVITAGRVRVDGKIVDTLGAKVDPKKARIEVDGRLIQRQQSCYGILHKPRGMVTTMSDPEGRPTAHDVLREVGVRVVPVGRLDYNTSGALLFTNDGDFAHVLSHARGSVPKVYAATVKAHADEKMLERWSSSIEIEGRTTRPAHVRVLRQEGDKTWLEVTIREGRNRQVRRLGEHANTPVLRLARLSHAGIDTEGLRPGQWRLLTIDELKALKKQYGVPEKIRGVMEPAHGRGGPRGAEKRAAGKKSSGGSGGRGKATAGWATAGQVGGRSKATSQSRSRHKEAGDSGGRSRASRTKSPRHRP